MVREVVCVPMSLNESLFDRDQFVPDCGIVPMSTATADKLGTGPAKATCGGCVHKRVMRHNDSRYLMCGLVPHMWTHGAASDLKANWPACSRWLPSGEDLRQLWRVAFGGSKLRRDVPGDDECMIMADKLEGMNDGRCEGVRAIVNAARVSGLGIPMFTTDKSATLVRTVSGEVFRLSNPGWVGSCVDGVYVTHDGRSIPADDVQAVVQWDWCQGRWVDRPR